MYPFYIQTNNAVITTSYADCFTLGL